MVGIVKRNTKWMGHLINLITNLSGKWGQCSDRSQYLTVHSATVSRSSLMQVTSGNFTNAVCKNNYALQ